MKLIVTDSGSPNEGIPSTNYTVETPFISKPVEQDEIKSIRLFQIQIEKVYQIFAVGNISSMFDFEIDEIQKSMIQDMVDSRQEEASEVFNVMDTIEDNWAD